MLDRDRTFAFILVLTILAIAGFGVFLVRDYHDRGYQGASSINLGVSGRAAANLPVTGADADPGATASPGSTTTTTGGSTAGPSVSGGGGRGGAPVSVPGGNQLACRGGEIKIGSIIPITGPVTEQDAANALVAYFRNVNNEGGINGCQVDFVYKDDGLLNNQQAIADAHALVQDEKVFAIVGPIEPVTTAVTEPYFVQQGVPVVGIEGVGINEYNNPVEYSFAEAPEGFGISASDFAASKGCKHVAVFYLDLDFAVKAYNALQSQASRNGQTIDYHNQESVASNSYGIDTLQARKALQNYDPKTVCVINGLDANSAVREINAMTQNQWYPNMVATTSTSDPVVLKLEASWFADSRHVVCTQRNYQPANANVSEVQEWIQTEGQYFPGFDANSYAEGSWLAAKVFTETARRLGNGNLTRNNLFAALNSLTNYHTGFTPDLTMTSDHGPNKQVMWLQYSGNSFQPITGFQPW